MILLKSIFASFIFCIFFASCGVEEFLPPDLLKPVSQLKAYPRNGAITLTLFSLNSESKLDGFNVYISVSSTLVGQSLTPIKNNDTVPTVIFSAADIAKNPYVTVNLLYDSANQRIQNGTTYYLAVKTHNYDNYESDLSAEVSTTPRVECVTQRSLSLLNGFSLKTGSSALPWDFRTILRTGELHLICDAANLKDEGYYPDPMLYNKAVDSGFAAPGISLKAVVGHLYLMKTSDNHFGKIYIDSTNGSAIRFRWAYQVVQGNLDI